MMRSPLSLASARLSVIMVFAPGEAAQELPEGFVAGRSAFLVRAIKPPGLCDRRQLASPVNLPPPWLRWSCAMLYFDQEVTWVEAVAHRITGEAPSQRILAGYRGAALLAGNCRCPPGLSGAARFGAAIRPSRCAFLRASLRARRIASA